VSQTDVPLVLWAANAMNHPLLERAEAVEPGGFDSMSLFTADIDACTESTGWSLAKLRGELEARGGKVSAIDPYLGWYPGWDPASVEGEAAALLKATEGDVLRFGNELGAPFLTLVAPFGGPVPEFDAIVESLGAFADNAAKAGVRPHLEVVPTSRVADVATALALVEAVDRENLGLLLDTYNMARGGNDPSELDPVPIERVFHIQLADAAADQLGADYFEDALHYRELPGDGGLEITEYMRRFAAKGELPPIGPEVFSDRLGAMSALEASLECGEKCRGFLDSVGIGTRPMPQRSAS
jgi:sugar phosphate isomerase/epimerase